MLVFRGAKIITNARENEIIELLKKQVGIQETILKVNKELVEVTLARIKAEKEMDATLKLLVHELRVN